VRCFGAALERLIQERGYSKARRNQLAWLFFLS